MSLPDILETLSGPLPDLATAGGPVHYRSLFHWVFSNGIPFDSQRLTAREWEMVGHHVVYTERRECFSNCQRTVLEPLFPQIVDIASGDLGVISPFSYVEGYVVTPEIPIPIHHGWLLLRGKVIDPTLRSHKKSRRKRFPQLAIGQFPDAREYYGTVIPWNIVAQCICQSRQWHTVLGDSRVGWKWMQVRD